MTKNGEQVAAFERAFADYVGARYGIALCNGTATLHTALAALAALREWIPTRPEVYVPPLTMASTSLAVLHAGMVPSWVDVDPDTWIMQQPGPGVAIPVALYGLNAVLDWPESRIVMDAAQTVMPHNPNYRFTSYSFQASKILPLGEGGMLVTNDEGLAEAAREFSSLGYRMRADQPRIDPASIKRPDAIRHHTLGWNYRMSDLVAAQGLQDMAGLAQALMQRAFAAGAYAEAVRGHGWLRGQLVPQGWQHDWWSYTVAVSGVEYNDVVARLVAHGGERPYAAWRLSYTEPAVLRVSRETGRARWRCPVAEELQPRLIQFQTNRAVDAERTAEALRQAILDIEGSTV